MDLRTLKKNIIICILSVCSESQIICIYVMNKKKIVLILDAWYHLYVSTIMSSSNAGTHWFQQSGEGKHAGGDGAINQHLI